MTLLERVERIVASLPNDDLCTEELSECVDCYECNEERKE